MFCLSPIGYPEIDVTMIWFVTPEHQGVDVVQPRVTTLIDYEMRTQITHREENLSLIFH
jgi:hypothetical protein